VSAGVTLFRFAPGRVGTSPVAAAIPFVIRFVIS